MQFISDFHLHSHYSRATSKQMNVEDLAFWGKIKGINIIGTGDFTHPAYFAELKEKLEETETGLFQLKKRYLSKIKAKLPASVREKLLRFVLTVEISNIYSKNGQVRKLHHLIIVPNLATAARINRRLARIGNLAADGRPILGLDSKELLKITLASHADSLFVPAHIWTPWFSLFGSKSGFNSLNEAFDELAPEIKAVETGLSSDPAMNWRIKDLDKLTLLSNSDAHSPQKLGREANIINCRLNYKEMIKAIKTGDKRFIGTIEFYPEEGKYHYDGHRACGVCFSPTESKKHQLLCPKCQRPLTLGVNYRVEELASRPVNFKRKNAKKVEYIIPLTEILAEINQVKNSHSLKIQNQYQRLIALFGDEFSILRQISPSKIQAVGFTELSIAIERLRKKQVVKQAGYDGVFGRIKVFKDVEDQKRAEGQSRLL